MAILNKNYSSIAKNSIPFFDMEAVYVENQFSAGIKVDFFIRFYDYKFDAQQYSWFDNFSLSNTYKFRIKFYSSATPSEESAINILFEDVFSSLYFLNKTEINERIIFEDQLINVAYKQYSNSFFTNLYDNLSYKIEFFLNEELTPLYEKTGKIYSNKLVNQAKVNTPVSNNEELLIVPIFYDSLPPVYPDVQFVDAEYACGVSPVGFLFPQKQAVSVPIASPVGVVATPTIDLSSIFNNEDSALEIKNSIEKENFINSKPKKSYFGNFFEFFDKSDYLSLLFNFDFENFAKDSDESLMNINNDYLSSLPKNSSIYRPTKLNTIVEIKKINKYNSIERVLTTSIDKYANSFGTDKYLGDFNRPYLVKFDVTLNNSSKTMLYFKDLWKEDKEINKYSFRIFYADEKREVLKKLLTFSSDLLKQLEYYFVCVEDNYFRRILTTDTIPQFRKDNIKDSMFFVDLYITINKAIVENFLITNPDLQNFKIFLKDQYEKTFFIQNITEQNLTIMKKFIEEFNSLIFVGYKSLTDKVLVSETEFTHEVSKKLSNREFKISTVALNTLTSFFPEDGSVSSPDFKVYSRFNSSIVEPALIAYNNLTEDLNKNTVKVSNSFKKQIFSYISKTFFLDQNKYLSENVFFIELLDKYLLQLVGPNFNYYKFDNSIRNFLETNLRAELIKKRQKPSEQAVQIDELTEYQNIFSNLVGDIAQFTQINNIDDLITSINLVFPNYENLFNSLKNDPERNIFFIYGLLYWLIKFGNIMRVEILDSISSGGVATWKLLNPSDLQSNNLYVCKLTRVTCEEIGIPYNEMLAFEPLEEYLIVRGA